MVDGGDVCVIYLGIGIIVRDSCCVDEGSSTTLHRD